MYSEVLWFDCMIIGGWFVVRFIHISYNFVVLFVFWGLMIANMHADFIAGGNDRLE